MENCWYAQPMDVWLVCIRRIQSLSSSSECIYTILPREMKCILCLCSKMPKFGSPCYLSSDVHRWTIGMLTQHLPRLQMANLRYVMWYQRWYCFYLGSCWWQHDVYQYWWHRIEVCQGQSFCCIEHCQKWWHYIVRCQMLKHCIEHCRMIQSQYPWLRYFQSWLELENRKSCAVHSKGIGQFGRE